MGTLIEFKNEILDSYLSGFFSMLNDILQKGEDLERIKQESAKESSKNSKRDNLIPIYMYCKNLWDKWLIAGDNTNALPYVNRFTVKEFFKNFLFIDSFYRNVYNLLAVNCQHFINLVEGINNNGGVDSTNLYSFLGNLASKTRCLFVAIPDYINLGTVDNEGKMLDTGIRNMEKIFKPIPLKDMRPIQTDNKFVIIYTHEPSKISSSNNGFLKDSFDLCDRNGKLTNEAEQFFGGIKLPSEETKRPVGFMGNMDTKAFPVPSFAVAFGGINNHLFQSIDVNMDNPIATEHSINITSQIAQMGSGNSQSIAYQGQDVYPIFSNYAYESKVEMMGNAQIQPLMYYQLMNIPMWKGAYMIFNVQHSITPGNMVTTFRGMKMSKNCVPYLEKWAYPVESPEGLPKLQLVGNDNVYDNSSYGYTDFGPISDVKLPNSKRNPGTGKILSNKSADAFVQKVIELFDKHEVCYQCEGRGELRIVINNNNQWACDCSSAPRQVYAELYDGIDIGGHSLSQWDSDNGVVVDINSSLEVKEDGTCDGKPTNEDTSKPNLNVLLPGDLLYYSKVPHQETVRNKRYNISHVEIYLGDGYIIGAGTKGKRTKKDALTYSQNYNTSKNKYYIGAKRFVYG